jgi:cobalamin transport system substrate-binding protein
MKRRAVVSLALGLLAFSSIARTSGPAPQATPAAHRIISLVPAVTEMIFAMGAGDDVVAVSSYDRYPPEARTRPSVGALIDPDFERIISLRPDLVIVYGTQTDLVARLARVNLPIFSYEHAGLADVTVTVRAIGARIGRAEAAERLAGSIERGLDDVRTSVAGRPRPRTALIFGRETGTLRGIFASGGVGFLHDLLEVAGGEDIFADVRRQSLQASAETLIARAPEVVLEIHPTEQWTPERLARERDVWRGLPSLPAVRNGRVYILADDVLLIPGPRVVEAARMMARTLHR